MGAGLQAGNRLDAADTGRDGGFPEDAEKPDLAGRPRVGPGTEFHRISIERMGGSADLNNAHGLAILVAEKLHDVRASTHVRIRHLDP